MSNTVPDFDVLVSNYRRDMRPMLNRMWDEFFAAHEPTMRAEIIRAGMGDLMKKAVGETDDAGFAVLAPSAVRQVVEDFLAEKVGHECVHDIDHPKSCCICGKPRFGWVHGKEAGPDPYETHWDGGNYVV